MSPLSCQGSKVLAHSLGPALATSLSEQLCAHGDHDLSLQVLKVNLLGHRKRIIASLADRPYEEPPAKPPRFSQLRVSPCSWFPAWLVCQC